MIEEVFPADLIIYNGNIITIDDQNPRAQAVAVWGSKIMFVGKNEGVKRFKAVQTKVIDLEGKTVIPGFNEAHNHLIGFGLKLNQMDLRYPLVRTIDDIQAVLRDKVQGENAGRWIIGSGYNDTKLAGRRHPTRWELDAVSPANPVVFNHTSLHMCVANSKAMELAGISRDTPDPEGGTIVRNAAGEPTGLLQESAQDLIKEVVPQPTVSEMREAIKTACKKYLEEGITSSQDAWLGLNSLLELQAYQEAWENEELLVRVNLMVDVRPLLKGGDLSFLFGLRGGFGNDMLRVGPLKVFADGSLIGRTAAMLEPYANDPGNTGLLVTEESQLYDIVLSAHKSGWQLAVHAIGDRAVKITLDAIERALQELPRENHRHRIEHCGVLNQELLQKIKQLNVIAVPQPRFISELGEGFMDVLGKERIKLTYPLRSLIKYGIKFAFSSDRPVVDGAPLLGIHDAVNEKTASGREYVFEEAITPEEAIRAYTLGGAYASFEEGIKGSLEVGKLADMAVLSGDPTGVPPEKIKDIEVLATIVGGKVLFEKLQS